MRKRVGFGVGMAIGAIAWALTGWQGAPLAALEAGASDARFALTPAPPLPDPKIVIVAIDEPSLDGLGSWPWSRKLHAELIRKLEAWGARAIAFDVTFSSRGKDAAADAALASAVAARNVVLAGQLHDRILVAGPAHGVGDLYAGPIFEAANGPVNLPLDAADGVLRQATFETRPGFRSFDAQVVAAVDPGLADRLATRFAARPFHIRFAGPPGTYPQVSYQNVLKGVLDPRIDPAIHPELPGTVRSYADFFRGKIVLVGATAPLLHDRFATPTARRDEMMTGVEVHANAIDTLRRTDPLAPVPAADGLALCLALGLLTAGLTRLRLQTGVLAGAGLLALYLACSAALFRAGLVVPVVGPAMALAATFPTVFGYRFLESEREKARIRATFSRYVAPKVVDEMLRRPDALPTLRNERRFITVLFTDIEGFTSFAEANSPDLVASRLNAILSALTEVVFAHGGTLDKYIGDAVMAIWGNIGSSDPEADAIAAVEAALAMQDALAALRKQWERAGASERLRVRIGIHSGDALVGNFGSELKLDFTAIGDTVNTASRLEGLNKEHGTSIIVSDATARLLGGRVPLRALGEQRLKGKAAGTLAFEVPTRQASGPAEMPSSKETSA